MIRILTGRFKNSIIKTCGKIRPTPGIVRKAVMDMFRTKIENNYIGDFFAGSGSFGIEALSNGAKKVVFFENDWQVIKILKENSLKFNQQDNTKENREYTSQKRENIGQSVKKNRQVLENNFEIVKINLIGNMIHIKNVLSLYNFSLSFLSPPFIFLNRENLSKLQELFNFVTNISNITILQFPTRILLKKNIQVEIFNPKFKIKNYGDNSIYIKE